MIKKMALAAILATVMILYFVGGSEKILDMHMYQDLFEKSPITTSLVFFVIFFIGTSCSLPITAVLAVTSGVLFGPFVGLLISSLATTMGGAVSFLSSRYILRDFIQQRFPAHIEVVNKGIETEGAFYIFGLRMIPVIPFWTLNLLTGLTSMPLWTFSLATMLGMIPILSIFAFTGSQLNSIETFSLGAVFTPGVIVSLILLASFPLIARALLGLTRRLAHKETN